MKKLLIVFFLLLLCGSCGSPVKESSVDLSIPATVITALHSDNAVNSVVYIIKTEKAHYYFNSKKELICFYDIEPSMRGAGAGWIVALAFVVGVFIGAFFTD